MTDFSDFLSNFAPWKYRGDCAVANSAMKIVLGGGRILTLLYIITEQRNIKNKK